MGPSGYPSASLASASLWRGVDQSCSAGGRRPVDIQLTCGIQQRASGSCRQLCLSLTSSGVLVHPGWHLKRLMGTFNMDVLLPGRHHQHYRPWGPWRLASSRRATIASVAGAGAINAVLSPSPSHVCPPSPSPPPQPTPQPRCCRPLTWAWPPVDICRPCRRCHCRNLTVLGGIVYVSCDRGCKPESGGRSK